MLVNVFYTIQINVLYNLNHKKVKITNKMILEEPLNFKLRAKW